MPMLRMRMAPLRVSAGTRRLSVGNKRQAFLVPRRRARTRCHPHLRLGCAGLTRRGPPRPGGLALPHRPIMCRSHVGPCKAGPCKAERRAHHVPLARAALVHAVLLVWTTGTPPSPPPRQGRQGTRRGPEGGEARRGRCRRGDTGYRTRVSRAARHASCARVARRALERLRGSAQPSEPTARQQRERIRLGPAGPRQRGPRSQAAEEPRRAWRVGFGGAGRAAECRAKMTCHRFAQQTSTTIACAAGHGLNSMDAPIKTWPRKYINFLEHASDAC